MDCIRHDQTVNKALDEPRYWEPISEVDFFFTPNRGSSQRM